MPIRRAAIALALALAAVATACTGDAEPGPSAAPPSSTEPTPSATPLPTRDPGAVEFAEGLFRYGPYNFVTAELRWRGGDGKLIVDNRSGRELGPPALYAVLMDQREVPADVREAAPIPTGGAVRFDVSFPDSVGYDETGLVVLLFGEENWGAFDQVPVDEA